MRFLCPTCRQSIAGALDGTRLPVSSRPGELRMIYLTDVLAVDKVGQHVRLHTRVGDFFERRWSLLEFERQFGLDFVRISQSVLVRRSYIHKIVSTPQAMLEANSGMKFKISTRYVGKVKKAMRRHS